VGRGPPASGARNGPAAKGGRKPKRGAGFSASSGATAASFISADPAGGGTSFSPTVPSLGALSAADSDLSSLVDAFSGLVRPDTAS